MKKVKFENNIRPQHLVFGYNIFGNEYVHLNYFLIILAFIIYKSYYVSEQNEFQRKMKENKLLGINALFNHLLNKL